MNAKNTDGMTALMLGAKNNHYDIVKKLIEKKVNINSKNYNNDSALSLAVNEGHYNIVKLLLQNGANVNIRNNKNNTCIITAVRNSDYKIIDEILSTKKLIHSDEKELFSIALYDRDENIIIKLLDYGFHPKLLYENQTLLVMAIKHNRINIIKKLLENKIDVDEFSNDPWKKSVPYLHPIIAAIRMGLLTLVDYIKKNSAFEICNVRDYHGTPPLMVAIKYHQYIVAQYLITRGGVNIDSINVRNTKNGHLKKRIFGKTALILCATYKYNIKENLKIAKCLIENKANINIQDESGKTALMYSIINDNFELTGQLIKENPDYEIKDNNGLTAFCYALYGKNKNIILLLRLFVKYDMDIIFNNYIQNISSMNTTCFVCNKVCRKKCSNCYTRYCDSTCQNIDWMYHQYVCNVVSLQYD